MAEPENQQVMEECFHCGGVMAHWRINAALRICTGCGNEIHKAEVIMAKHFTDAERAGIQLRLANGEKAKDIAKELGRSFWTIQSIKGKMPKGLKGKKLEAALQAAVDKHAIKGSGSMLPAALPRGVDLKGAVETSRPRPVGPSPIKDFTDAVEHKRWIVALINRRLDLIRDELINLVW